MSHSIHRQVICAIVAGVLACAGGAAQAADNATREEAVAFVKKVIAYYKSAGKAKAVADISAKDNKFVDRELYATVMEISTGVVLADSRNPRTVGKNLSAVKDADGKEFIREQLYIGKTGNPSWVDYRWPNPVSQAIESKTTYCEPHDGLIFCAGFYRGV